ncbi:uncharacterized protein LOC110993889 [Pieris rapae]|uniref:uncharacterized protein LOC110993889 n=1 Tax=Pieris rapae TaxID=64459 RepID=UPI001E27AC81|nr:uncharacterized protein LOC110993889 [Pieris rapae]
MLWQLTVAALVVSVCGHARVWSPPGRATAWRLGFKTPPDYDDTGLNCGGFNRQHDKNKGRCGICGDAYDLPSPRPHELGGKYGQGTIVANFTSKQIINVSIEMTAFHQGYWYLNLCPDAESQECFDKYPLELKNGGFYFFPHRDGNYTVQYRLPKISCEHCVLQWRYVAGNNWGHCSDGTEGMGCGTQETFGSCSDIRIMADQQKRFKFPRKTLGVFTSKPHHYN